MNRQALQNAQLITEMNNFGRAKEDGHRDNI